MTNRPVRGGAQHQLLIDPGAGQQMLHPVRARVPGGLAHRPAVMILQLAQQAVHHVTACQAGLPPGEARSDPRHQVIEQAACPSWSTVAAAAAVQLSCSANRRDHGSRAHFPPASRPTSAACQASAMLPRHDSRDLRKRNPGHDLQLPYQWILDRCGTARARLSYSDYPALQRK
jgi:hypothetical protein